MTIEQTVEIPASLASEGKRRLTIDVPPEVPAGRVVLTFTPEGETCAEVTRDTPEYLRRKAMLAQSMEYYDLHAERLNREMEDVLEYQGDIFQFGSPFSEDDFVLPPAGGK
jgi:hypothetical protein